MNARRALTVTIVVIVLLSAALVHVRAENEKYHVDAEPSDVGLTVGTQLSEDGFPSDSSRLWVYGNANEDDDIDEDDMRYLLGVLSGENPATVLSDANCDGVVDEDDLVYIQRIIESDSMDVFYIDNYYRVASVSWPVERIAIGYCSGAYVADLTGVTNKVVLVDDTIKNYWGEMNGRFSSAGSFGATETPNYETMIAAGIDVYVVGYCDANADELSPSRLNPVGIDVMFISTADNSGVDIPNENIDRSILMFSFLLQGDMHKTDSYIEWHDGLLKKMVEVTSKIPEDEREAMLMTRTSALYSTGTYSITGKDNTNNIHAEWVGVDAVGQHCDLLPKNYQSLDVETLATVMIQNQHDGRLFFVDNAHDGMRHQYDLGECLKADSELLSNLDVEIHYLGMAREMGNSPLYVVEMAFYVCIMYPEVAESVGLDYKDLFHEYFEKFASTDYWLNLDIEDFFLDYGVA